ncbi:MAG: hypothetical protein PsegKO_09070 [Pseudohongiellaceae bacterium]
MVAENARFFKDEMPVLLDADYWITDFTDVTTADITASHVKAIAQPTLNASKQKPNPSVGQCAPQSQLHGLSKMWMAIAEETGWERQVKPSRKEVSATLEEHLGGPVADWPH